MHTADYKSEIPLPVGLQIRQNTKIAKDGIHPFGRICNPTALSISIFNTKKKITKVGLQIRDTLTYRIKNSTEHKIRRQ